MRKFFILGLTILILSFVFISCDNGTGSGNGGDPTPTEIRGTYNHTDGSKFVIGTNSVTVTLTGGDTFTLPYFPNSAGPKYYFGESGPVDRLFFDNISPNVDVTIVRNDVTVYHSSDTGWTKE